MKLPLRLQAPERCLIDKYWVVLYQFLKSDTATLPALDAAVERFLNGSSSAVVAEATLFSHQIYDAVFHDGLVMDIHTLEQTCTYYLRKPLSHVIAISDGKTGATNPM